MDNPQTTPLQDLYEKIEWEGGLIPALDYGILPEEVPEEYPELRAMLADVIERCIRFESAAMAFERRLREAVQAEVSS